MSEIKAGDYVRTNKGIIGKIETINKYGVITKYDDEEDKISTAENYYINKGLEVNEDDIVKHSKNIIDLIEIGDIVNNHYVKAVYLDGAVKYIKLDNAYSPENHFTGVRTYEDDIETILTKEQMEANQYVVKRNMETN